MKKIEAIQKLFLILSIPQAIGTIIASVGSMIGVVILLMINPFFGILFGVLLAIVAFAIIAIFAQRRAGQLSEKKIQFQHNLEKKARHNKGEEPKITIWQKFSNASDFKLKIKSIDAIAKVKKIEIARFHYNKSDNLFFNDDKLFFPEEIVPLDLDNAIEYRINDITKLAKIYPDYKKHAILIEFGQAIEFATEATAILKTVNDTVTRIAFYTTVNISPDDWKGGGQ